MNILLTIAYDGGAYHGFQVQKNALAVCTVVQDALEALFGTRPDVKGCSRTDAGVHARAFCLNLHHETAIPDEKLPLALNFHLPQDVRVLRARRVPEGFHARYSATGKRYRYVLLDSRIDDPFTRGHYHRVAGPVDEEAMHEAAQVLVGRHDFAAFQSAGSSIEDTVRTVAALDVKREGDWVLIDIAADGFLYNMVRIIAGSLLRVGTGRWKAADLAAALEGRDRSRAGETLPPEGLFLEEVFYPEEAFLEPEADEGS